VHVCGSDSLGIVKAVLWRVQCNRVRSRSIGEDIMVVQCPVRRLSIVRRDRSCMLEQWATIQRHVDFALGHSFFLFLILSAGESSVSLHLCWYLSMIVLIVSVSLSLMRLMALFSLTLLSFPP
jgi:hypothetical protein